MLSRLAADPAMTAGDAHFWRSYWPLLFAVVAAQLGQQADIIMMGRVGGSAPGAYAMLARLAIVDVVFMTATGAVASTTVAHAQQNGDAGRIAVRVLLCSAVCGLLCCTLGLTSYPCIAKRVAAAAETGAVIEQGFYWYSLAAPFRFISSTSAFVLHALGQGGVVAKWKLIEFIAKSSGNVLFMEFMGYGFRGCFIVDAVVVTLSSIWCVRFLGSTEALEFNFPDFSWTAQFLHSTFWEGQRIVAVQLAALASLFLFSAPWIGTYEVSRSNAYAAGQSLMLIAFAPLIALLRFLAFRLAAAPKDQLEHLLFVVWRQGLPVAVIAAAVLWASPTLLGGLYGQVGPWWSFLVQALAASLPLRYTTNVMRAALQSQRAFRVVATTDSFAFWLLAMPLITGGLYCDSPFVAYLSLFVPEAICAASLWRQWRRLQSSSNFKLANAKL